MSGSHLSKDFFNLVKSIGESKSKTEEDRIILSEVSSLKRRLAGKNDDYSTTGAAGASVGGGGGGSSSASSALSGEKDDHAMVKKKAKEFLVRIMYVEMLGHDASFGYIKVRERTDER